ncbi:MAG: phosphate acyltransferase PlsX [Candidatus Omnitrophica bacterium]|nr:phosphate acyltransferase PlsX [Candidatus Omnitrophota bacterium]
MQNKKVRIAIDAMGGDRAPRVIVEGALMAAEEFDYKLDLVGDTRKIEKFLNVYDYPKDKISVVHASEVVKMGEPAAASFRRKKDSSIAVGMRLLRDKKTDIFISAGNTGAVVTAAALTLKTLPHIERPGIAIVFPSLKEPILIIDMGANIDAKPVHLFQYAVMGWAYIRYILHRENPSIGLLNIGEEESKGTSFIKEARDILKKSSLNFVGNIEARDVFRGKVDVVVCDGFIGNIVLKITESFAHVTTELLKRELNRRLLPKIGAILSLPAYRAIRKKIDYTEYGGAPLLGVDGAVLISHGSSNAVAIKSAVRVAGEYVKHRVNEHIVERLEECMKKIGKI